ncbi:MAG TPA: fatty acid desaturase [Acidimicrobiia bacterium]|jgi:stearoyl-CoA desaturase (delta-9 desaturase)
MSSTSLLTDFLLALALGFVVTQVAIVITSVWLHRSLAHKSLTVSGPVTIAFRFVIWITTGMKPREWAAIHRKHHAATDTAEDPHSPRVHGFWRVQLGNVGLYRRAARDVDIARKYGRDLPPDRLDTLFFDHALLGLAIGVAMMMGVTVLAGLGWEVGLLAAGLHALMYVMLSGAVNAVGHKIGRRPYDNSATNLRTLAMITGGEGLHNNHHAVATSARFSLHKGEPDPGWWTIRTLVAMKLARLRHQDIRPRETIAA